MNAVKKVQDQIDWTIVTSTIVAGVVVGLMAYGAKKAGLGQVATVVKGG